MCLMDAGTSEVGESGRNRHIGSGKVLYLKGLENTREARAILINILIFINNERPRTLEQCHITPNFRVAQVSRIEPSKK